jgi:hypothetical protein
VVKLRYLHRNPVKRGLVSNLEDWKWSSYRHYAFREIGMVEIESEWTARDREQKARGGMPQIFLRPGWRPKPGREPGAPGYVLFGLNVDRPVKLDTLFQKPLKKLETRRIRPRN